MRMQIARASIPSIDVVAAVLRDRQGQVLVTERPLGKPLAGYWEFPGGKLETGESAYAAMRRELNEELGIEVQQAYRLLRFTHTYPERRVDLDVWRVTSYIGEPAAHEGQRLAWVAPDAFPEWNLLPADAPILDALRLPPLMLVTPTPQDESLYLSKLHSSLAAGVDMVQFRAPGLEPRRFERLARATISACREYGARAIVNADPDTALRLGADGVHLSQRQFRSMPARRTDDGLLTGLSCHSMQEMAAAHVYQPDYLILGAVQNTPTHADRACLGWERFSVMVSSINLPVYAIGGLTVHDLVTARAYGGHGIAAVRGLWGISQLSE